MTVPIGNHDARGSLWRRWDLHFHTPSSFDYEDSTVTNERIVESLIDRGVEGVAITDHHTIDVDRIQKLQKLGGNKMCVFPGIELRDDHGGDPVHYICIFPENCDLNHVWTTLQGSLGLTAKAIKEKGGDEKVYVPISRGAEEARKLGGIVSIHAGAKSNSIESIKNREQFQQRIKYDITKNWVDLMEIGQLKDIDVHLNLVFPATGLDRPLIMCSDNHNCTDYSCKAPLWLKADPTFRGLLMTLREPRDRVYIGHRPPEMIQVEKNPTKYIRSLSFSRKAETPSSEKWFSGSIAFSTGLVAIVGNKGSGKSALADTLGLLGSTKNVDFSFLSRERFRHPTGGFAQHFDATIEWVSGETTTRCLADTVKSEEVERLKYLPQDHVEKVCNEIVRIGEEGFEQELKSVIFSHVPEPQRLGYASLDRLVMFRTGEKQKRIDSLLKQLKEKSRSRAILEAQADPAVRLKLLEKIAHRRLELEAHYKLKPVEVSDPSTTESTPSPEEEALLRELSSMEDQKREIAEQIANAEETLTMQERRLAVAKRLIEKLDNFQKDFATFKEALAEDAEELGLSVNEIVALTIKDTEAVRTRDQARTVITATTEDLDRSDPPGLRNQREKIEISIADIYSKLDAPNRQYQAYLKEVASWEEKRAEIEGTKDSPESLAGLTAALTGLEELPEEVASLKTQQKDLAIEIHQEKQGQAEVYRDLYGSIQNFIDSHYLAKDKLKLEFRVDIVNDNFTQRLLEMLHLNRRGTFMGTEEGHSKAEELVQTTKWDDIESVRSFLDNIDTALHFDLRDSTRLATQVKDQLVKGRNTEEVFDLLYGLEYLRPKYVLRWEGKDLSMLSPGERGTLLLVFYLLVDKGDMPLIIDQPEGNLDNHTVAKVLVDCIKAAKRLRQVFIVTHNPNLAVVCDADQIVHADMKKAEGNAISYTTGALENPAMSEYVTDVLEGTRWAFDVRGLKYEVGNQK